jgi:hypothetical protein
LFSDPAERSIRPTRTISGKPMTVPEEIGTFPRRARLMAAAVQEVQPHPLAQAGARGFPLGDGHGMEDVVGVVRPLFAAERSLTRWVAIRGALLFLDMVTPNQASWENIMAAMGLRLAPDPFTNEERIEVLQADGEQLSPALQGNITGVFASLAMHLEDYERVSNMPIKQVNTDPAWAIVSEAVALDFIAWAAVALCRTGELEAVMRMPEPGLLEQPGWYADPLWAKGERFWDGTDWTERMRVRDGRRWIDGSQPLR